MRIDLNDIGIFNTTEFAQDLDIDNNEMLDSTGPGQWMKQTVPSIYFLSNNDFQIQQNTALPGLLLTIASTEKLLIFCYEFYENPFIQYFDSAKHKFATFLKVDREKIVGYAKKDQVKFTALKPKKSYEFMSNMQGAPVGGLITSTLFKGAFKLAGKLEAETIEKTGYLYTLMFSDNNVVRSIDIACEDFYTTDFDSFLTAHWKSEKPEKPKEEPKGGCFIATACYGDYNHPQVVVLRQFRDDILNRSKIGRLLISIYYQLSPPIARQIAKREGTKKLIRFSLIYPLVKLISKK